MTFAGGQVQEIDAGIARDVAARREQQMPAVRQKVGKRCEFSFRLTSSTVIGSGEPAGCGDAVKRHAIVRREDDDAFRIPGGAEQGLRSGRCRWSGRSLPSTSIFFSRSPAAKPMNRPSGDQNDVFSAFGAGELLRGRLAEAAKPQRRPSVWSGTQRMPGASRLERAAARQGFGGLRAAAASTRSDAVACASMRNADAAQISAAAADRRSRSRRRWPPAATIERR